MKLPAVVGMDQIQDYRRIVNCIPAGDVGKVLYLAAQVLKGKGAVRIHAELIHDSRRIFCQILEKFGAPSQPLELIFLSGNGLFKLPQALYQLLVRQILGHVSPHPRSGCSVSLSVSGHLLAEPGSDMFLTAGIAVGMDISVFRPGREMDRKYSTNQVEHQTSADGAMSAISHEIYFTSGVKQGQAKISFWKDQGQNIYMNALTKVIVVRDFHAWLSPAGPGMDAYMKALTKVIIVRGLHAWLSPAVPGF